MKSPKISVRVQRFGNCIVTQYIQNKTIIETVVSYI